MVSGDEIRVGDAERQVVIESIQRAMADGYVQFGELEARFEAVYAADTRGQLDAVTADLPGGRSSPQPIQTAQTTQPAAPSGAASTPALRQSVTGSRFTLLGDSKVGGWISVGSDLAVTTVIGDSTVDLSTAEFPAEGVSVVVRSIIGDVRVIVPDGASVDVSVVSAIGSRKEIVTAPRPGGPSISLQLMSLVGDVHVYSLSQVPEGKLRKLWNSLRAR